MERPNSHNRLILARLCGPPDTVTPILSSIKCQDDLFCNVLARRNINIYQIASKKTQKSREKQSAQHNYTTRTTLKTPLSLVVFTNLLLYFHCHLRSYLGVDNGCSYLSSKASLNKEFVSGPIKVTGPNKNHSSLIRPWRRGGPKVSNG